MAPVKFVGKSAKPEPSTSAIFGRSFVFERMNFAARSARANSPLRAGFRAADAHRSMIPTIEADIRLAIVPASMARIPSRASSASLIGSERADAADLNADRAEIRETAQRKSGDREGARIERVFASDRGAGRRPVRSSPCASRAGCRSPGSHARECRSAMRSGQKPSRKSARGSKETTQCRAKRAGCARRRNMPSTR